MSRRSQLAVLSACSAVLVTVACSTGSSPAGPNPNPTATTLTLVSPTGGATNVDPAASVMLRFSGPMAQGMEGDMDLHMGTTAGAVMPMACAWSADRTTLTCSHAAPFARGTMYTIHVGGGMRDANGKSIDMDDMVNMMGGAWLQPGMMGGMHAGQPMGMMGPGWQGSNGSFGMTFSFTTA